MNPERSEIIKALGPTDEGGSGEFPGEHGDFVVVLARLAKALGHPARVEILRYLLSRGECVCGDIVRRLPLVQSTVSAHLRRLREAGLVSARREKCWMVYRVNPGVIDHMRGLLGLLVGGQMEEAAD